MATELELRQAYDAGVRSVMEKRGQWSFALPIAALDAPAGVDIPKYMYRTIAGPDKDDQKSPSRLMAAGLTVSTVLSTLFALGFAGYGMKSLGRKLQYIASKRKGVLPKTDPLYHTSRVMSMPTPERYREAWSKAAPIDALRGPMGAAGAGLGHVVSPFSRLENYLTRQMAGRTRDAMAYGKSLEAVGGGPVFDNPATEFAMNPLAIAMSIGLDSALVAAQKRKEQEAKARKSPARRLAEAVDPTITEELEPGGKDKTIQQKILGTTADVLLPKKPEGPVI